ncbi:hypothetical protein C5O27_17150 [Gordonia alkanivorans]|nr:hypothetical protein C5O27_17150 [Gordonia alkanivorans]
MPNYAAPIGRAEERRLRVRAQNRLHKLLGRLLDYDADELLAVHETLDRFYADLAADRAEAPK